MNTSPDSMFRQLAAEQKLADSMRPPKDPELAADWRLRQELRELNSPNLPARLRQQVLAQTRRGRRPAWWMGLAAAITLALAVGLIHQSTQQTADPIVISDRDLQQLQLALSTLEHSARRTGDIAGRELAANLTWPNLGLEQAPYGPALRHWFQAIPDSDT